MKVFMSTVFGIPLEDFSSDTDNVDTLVQRYLKSKGLTDEDILEYDITDFDDWDKDNPPTVSVWVELNGEPKNDKSISG